MKSLAQGALGVNLGHFHCDPRNSVNRIVIPEKLDTESFISQLHKHYGRSFETFQSSFAFNRL